MSLDKAIAHGKEKRKPYRGAKAVDATCRNHGSDKWCEENRRHKMRDKLDSISTEEDLFPELTDEEKTQNKEIAKNYPCFTCIWSPPSSGDGKPCSQCDPNNSARNCYQRKEEGYIKFIPDPKTGLIFGRFTPVKRNADGAIGLYDVYGENFYPIPSATSSAGKEATDG